MGDKIIDEAFLVSEKVLNMQRVSHQWRTGPSFQQTINYEEVLRTDFDDRLHILEGYVLSEHLADDYYEDTFYYDVPKSTWQMFKFIHAASWWLGWFVSRWPVKNNTKSLKTAVQVGRYVNYPEAHIPIKDLGHPYLFETMRPLEPWEIRQREEDRAAEEEELDEAQVEVFLLVEETLDDLAAATGLERKWFESAMAFDKDFGLQSKIYVIPQEVHDA
jgi:hypothetical protein